MGNIFLDRLFWELTKKPHPKMTNDSHGMLEILSTSHFMNITEMQNSLWGTFLDRLFWELFPGA